MGRHDEAIAAVDEAVHHLEGARPEGAEHVHRWRSEILAAAGRTTDAKAAAMRAETEVEAKAAKLRIRAAKALPRFAQTRGLSALISI